MRRFSWLCRYALLAFIALLLYLQGKAVWTFFRSRETAHDGARAPASGAAAADGGFCPATACPAGTAAVREAFRAAPGAVAAVRANPANKFVMVTAVPGDDRTKFALLLRDPRRDTFISGLLARGQRHDPSIGDLVVRSVGGRDDDPVFVDVGANIGYFTAMALAVGARTISFEPFYENAGVLMNTLERNPGWRPRAALYMNPLGYEASRVTMEPTNGDINLSNMHITGSHCAAEAPPAAALQYGVDYMETVSLDQVMRAHHPDVRRVHLMKIDVETFEIQVLNGALRTLCDVVVERIAVEVEYLKPHYDLPIPCTFARMRETLVALGYEVLDVAETRTLTHLALEDLPADALFRLGDTTRSPASRLRGSAGNPCQRFE